MQSESSLTFIWVFDRYDFFYCTLIIRPTFLFNWSLYISEMIALSFFAVSYLHYIHKLIVCRFHNARLGFSRVLWNLDTSDCTKAVKPFSRFFVRDDVLSLVNQFRIEAMSIYLSMSLVALSSVLALCNSSNMRIIEHINLSSLSISLILALTLLTWSSWLAIYRIHLHSLFMFSKPKLAIATYWYEFYFEIVKGNRYIWKLVDLHKQYDENLNSMNDKIVSLLRRARFHNTNQFRWASHNEFRLFRWGLLNFQTSRQVAASDWNFWARFILLWHSEARTSSYKTSFNESTFL